MSRLAVSRVGSFCSLLVRWVARDFRLRYTQTVLGAAWALFQPLIFTATFFVLFSSIADIETSVPYLSFVLIGMLVWTLFGSAVSTGVNAMSNTMYVASKASYPRIVAPLSAALLPLVDLAIGLALAPAVLLVQDTPVDLNVSLFLVSVLGVVILSSGVVCLLSALTIFVRDLRSLVPPVIQVLLLLTPVAYPSDRLPASLELNPLATLISGFRASILEVPAPTAGELTGALMVSVVVLAIGVGYFQRVQHRFADVA